MKKTLFILILCVLVLPLLCAAPGLASFTDEWGEFQDDETNIGFVHDITGHWNQSTTPTTVTIGAGQAQYQPITLSVSDQSYMIITSATTLKAYTVDTTGASLVAEEVIPGSLTTPPQMTNYNGTDYILVGNLTHVLSYTFDGSDFVLNNSNGGLIVTTNDDNISGCAIRCNPDARNACYFISIHNNVCEWNIIDGYNATCTVYANTTTDTNVKYPAIGDVDLDGNKEIVWTRSATVTAFDVTAQAVLWNVSLAIHASANSYPSNPLISQVDGGGVPEVFVGQAGFSGGGDPQFSVRVLKGNDGSTLYTGTQSPFNSAFGAGSANQPSIAACDRSNSQYDFCVSGGTIQAAASDPLTGIECYSLIGASFSNTLDKYNRTQSAALPGIACADLDTDGVDDVVFWDKIYDYTNTSIYNVTLNIADQLILSDLNGDNELEIISSRASNTQVRFSDFTNEPPTLNNSLNRGGYFGYMNPACLDSTVTFQAQECGGVADCNYENDASEDTERIVTTCGISGASLDNGTFVLSNPTFDCVYNTTGTYNVRLFLQDDANPTDFTQYNTQYITLLVIDGIPGSTCDVPSSIIDAPSDQGGIAGTGGTAYASDELSSVLDDLFGADTAFKNMIAIGIIIAVASSAAAVGGMAAGAIAAIAVTVLVMILGLLSVWIMVLLIALMLLGIVVSKMIFSSAA